MGNRGQGKGSGKQVKHDELLYCLENHLNESGNIAIPNMCLGSRWVKSASTTPGIADIVCFRPHYNRKETRIFEIKVSRSDLFADIRAEKWKKYLPYCEYVVFAFPRGMARLDEIPIEAGVWTYNADKKTWSASRRGLHSDPSYGNDFWFAALLGQKTRVDKRIAQIDAEQDLIKYGHADQWGKCFKYSQLDIIGLSSRVKAIVRENTKLKMEIDNK